jgi:hypothetical protein
VRVKQNDMQNGEVVEEKKKIRRKEKEAENNEEVEQGKRLTRIASGESIWGSRSKKGKLLKNQ